MPTVMEGRSGLCPKPFLEAASYPSTGGFIPGRFCAPNPGTKTVCCLPCPQTDWVYGDNFRTLTRAANYVNLTGMICSVFLLASFAFLPVAKTHRHYLSVSLVIGIILMQLGFIIPLGARPDQCYNDITPHDMYSSVPCALSGACLLAGGWCGVMWVFMRAVSLHLQICWELVPGKKFFYGAQLAGWGVPAIACAVALAITGVSYRFGDTCHINHKDALKDVWGPMLGFAGMAIVVQFATFGYCLQVYLRSLMESGPSTQNSSSLPSYSSSLRTIPTARQAYRRIRKVLSLQWRGIFVVVLIVADVVFFSVVFVFMDSKTQTAKNDVTVAKPWLLCLISNSGDKNKCLDLTKDLVLNETTVMAVLLLLSLNGIWLLVALGRWSMFTGWFFLIKSKFSRKTDFVSVDAPHHHHRASMGPRTYEMLNSTPHPDGSGTKSPDPLLISTTSPPSGTYTPNLKEANEVDYFGQQAPYRSPHFSFSSPKAPQRPGSDSDWKTARQSPSIGPTKSFTDTMGRNKI